MAALLPFWSIAGEVHQLDGWPESLEDWSRGEIIDSERLLLLNAVESAMGHQVASTRVLSQDMNLTLEAAFDDGSSLIVRQCYLSRGDEAERSWATSKFNNEINLVNWLEQNSKLPVPHYRAVVKSSTGSPFAFVVMDKLAGNPVFNIQGIFKPAAKERLIACYADAVLELFRLPVPQKIGSTSAGMSADEFTMTPRIGANPLVSADKVFDDISEYMAYFFSLKRRSPVIGSDGSALLSAQAVISDLEAHVRLLLERVIGNILADSHGNITGILDWELHSIQPAILAAEYPNWLSYDGVEDPRFANPDNWWLESPAESARLRELFEQMVKARDPEYYQCLRDGALLRSAVGWLADHHSDPGLERMRRWMDSAFYGT